ncbi:hypothetical protein [Rhizobium halophytocola]|uniref:DUF4328 domain-containing protein n=1 Tax=Rhizobium halophytocola TaxID=735519 RepID=A0ABS4E2I3_9HYPH|nr:hypothetical protein [Rhizobium halophytocola]MBP1852145.1 hypothetical protein [Rhizobium halophytocola]
MTSQIRIPLFTRRIPRRPVEIQPMTPLQTLPRSQAAINRRLTYALGAVLAFSLPTAVAHLWASAAWAQEADDVVGLAVQDSAVPFLLTVPGVVTATILAACGLASTIYAFAILLRPRRSGRGEEVRAAIAFALTLPSRNVRPFLHAFNDGDVQALSICWPEWTAFQCRWLMTEPDWTK